MNNITDERKTSNMTELRAPLTSYKYDLLLLPYNRYQSSLVDCCDYILDAIEGSSYDRI